MKIEFRRVANPFVHFQLTGCWDLQDSAEEYHPHLVVLALAGARPFQGLKGSGF